MQLKMMPMIYGLHVQACTGCSNNLFLGGHSNTSKSYCNFRYTIRKLIQNWVDWAIKTQIRPIWADMAHSSKKSITDQLKHTAKFWKMIFVQNHASKLLIFIALAIFQRLKIICNILNKICELLFFIRPKGVPSTIKTIKKFFSWFLRFCAPDAREYSNSENETA